MQRRTHAEGRQRAGLGETTRPWRQCSVCKPGSTPVLQRHREPGRELGAGPTRACRERGPANALISSFWSPEPRE